MNEPMKLCKDCKHYWERPNDPWWHSYPKPSWMHRCNCLRKLSPVDGRPLNLNCFEERKGACGPDGDYWEPKDGA
jgi:hypothetical protein